MGLPPEKWEELKAIKGPEPVMLPGTAFNGSNRATRRAHGWYQGSSRKGSGRSVRPSDTKEALRARSAAKVAEDGS